MLNEVKSKKNSVDHVFWTYGCSGKEVWSLACILLREQHYLRMIKDKQKGVSGSWALNQHCISTFCILLLLPAQAITARARRVEDWYIWCGMDNLRWQFWHLGQEQGWQRCLKLRWYIKLTFLLEMSSCSCCHGLSVTHWHFSSASITVATWPFVLFQFQKWWHCLPASKASKVFSPLGWNMDP